VASILKTGKGDATNFTVILRDMTAIARMRSELIARIRELEVANSSKRLEQVKLAKTERLLDELLRQSHSY